MKPKSAPEVTVTTEDGLATIVVECSTRERYRVRETDGVEYPVVVEYYRPDTDQPLVELCVLEEALPALREALGGTQGG